MSVAGLRTAARETVSGLPREFWWLWLSTLVNRLGGFVATFMALYLTLDRGYSASYAGLVAALHGLGGFIAEHSYLAGFLGEALMTLACAVVVFVKVPESRPAQAAPVKTVGGERAKDEVRITTVLRDGRFMGVVGLSFLVALVFQQGYVGLPVAMGADGLSSSDFGTAIAVNGVLIVALQIPVTRFAQHRDPRRLLIISSLLAGYGFGLTVFAGSVAVYALTVCVWTLAEIVNAPPRRVWSCSSRRLRAGAATRACTRCPGRWPPSSRR